MERKSAREQLRKLHGKQKWTYIWDYYRIQIIAAVLILAACAGILPSALAKHEDPDLTIAIVNNTMNVDQGTDFYDEFTSFADDRGVEGTWQFDSGYFFDLSEESDFTNSYYQKLVARIESGELDGMILDRANLEGIARGGRVLDLSDESVREVMNQYGDRAVWYTDENGEKIPVGIDVSDSPVISRCLDYETAEAGGGTAVFAFSAQPANLENAEIFLGYLLQDNSE